MALLISGKLTYFHWVRVTGKFNHGGGDLGSQRWFESGGGGHGLDVCETLQLLGILGCGGGDRFKEAVIWVWLKLARPSVGSALEGRWC